MKYILKLLEFAGGLVAFTFLLLNLVGLLFFDEIIYYERSLFILILEIIFALFILLLFVYDHAENILKSERKRVKNMQNNPQKHQK